MKGTLTDQPLVELIREISSKGLSGTLRLEHERAKTAVYFEEGQLVFAASNLRKLRLRDYLTKRALVTEKELAAIDQGLSDPGLAATLCANGALQQEEVNALMATLVIDVLRVALLWTEGTWEFDERARLGDPVQVRLDTNSLVREAAQRMPLKFVSQRFQNPQETISRSEQFSEMPNFLPAESFILSRLDAPTKLQELVAMSGLRELDARRVIYGLALGGLVTREYWQNAFRTAQSKPAKEQTIAGVSPQSAAKESAPVINRWAVPKEKDDLEIFLERVRKANSHYEVMDLPANAEASEIKDAYYALARRYHPDIFHLKSGTALHTQISSAFAKVTQAYETLTDANARAAYDGSLERSRQFSESAPAKVDRVVESAGESEQMDSSETEAEQAEYHYREGFGALQQGRIGAAMTHLATASRLEPGDARYRAYYGRALAADEKTRRLAESEIQAAVKLEPSNPVYRTMLAELYFELKFTRRAQTEVERALALDPNNASALNLLRKLERSRKAG
jgi:curved DNA-binding protein CbpA